MIHGAGVGPFFPLAPFLWSCGRFIVHKNAILWWPVSKYHSCSSQDNGLNSLTLWIWLLMILCKLLPTKRTPFHFVSYTLDVHQIWKNPPKWIWIRYLNQVSKLCAAQCFIFKCNCKFWKRVILITFPIPVNQKQLGIIFLIHFVTEDEFYIGPGLLFIVDSTFQYNGSNDIIKVIRFANNIFLTY